MFSAADKEDPIIKQYKDEYRILSLSCEYNNPQLWAHYANKYEGVCLCFNTEMQFGCIKEVKYCSCGEACDGFDEKAIRRGVVRSFQKKHSGWSYEKEWRIIKKKRGNYLRFKNNELKGIIFGHRMSDEIANFISANIDSNILKMKTDIGYRSLQVNILPFTYQYIWDGSPLRVLNVEESLRAEKYIFE